MQSWKERSIGTCLTCGRREALSDSSPLWRIVWSNCSRTAFEKLALIVCQSRRESVDIRGMSSRDSASSIVKTEVATPVSEKRRHRVTAITSMCDWAIETNSTFIPHSSSSHTSMENSHNTLQFYAPSPLDVVGKPTWCR